MDKHFYGSSIPGKRWFKLWRAEGYHQSFSSTFLVLPTSWQLTYALWENDFETIHVGRKSKDKFLQPIVVLVGLAFGCNEGLRSLAQGQLLIHLNRKTGQQQKHSYVCVPLFTGAKMFIRPWMFYYHKKGDLVNLRFPWVIPEWKCRRALHGQRRTSRPHQMDPILMGWWGPSV